MKTFKQITLVLVALLIWNSAEAGSSSTSSVVKDGKRITTKIKTDNKGTTTVITTKDKDGTIATTTTVTDKAGNIISSDDPEAQAKADKAGERKAEIAKAPRRAANEPIVTAVFRTVIDENLKKATENRLFPAYRAEYNGHAVVQAMDQKAVDNYDKSYDFKSGKSKGLSSFSNDGGRYLAADVYVVTFARLEEKVGISKATKKLATAPFLTYRAEISTEYGDGTWKVEHKGHILNNVQVTKEFVAKIQDLILNQVGPQMPTDAACFRRGGKDVQVDGDQVKDALKNLFKKKK